MADGRTFVEDGSGVDSLDGIGVLAEDTDEMFALGGVRALIAGRWSAIQVGCLSKNLCLIMPTCLLVLVPISLAIATLLTDSSADSKASTSTGSHNLRLLLAATWQLPLAPATLVPCVSLLDVNWPRDTLVKK